MKLTKTYIDALTYTGNGKSATVHWDERIPGFGIRVMPSGTKVFILKYRFFGQQRWMSIGRHGAITLHQALKMAQDRYLDVKAGKDPKSEAERVKFAGKTVAQLCDYYLEHHAEIKKDANSIRNDRSNIKNWIRPHIGKVPVRELKSSHIAALHNRIGKDHRVQANRVRSLVSKMFNEAKVWGFVDKGTPNPVEDVKPFKEIPRERFLSFRDELPRIAAEINKRDPWLRALIWLYLLTGLRKKELLTLKWKHVNLEEQWILIKDTKTDRPLKLPLSAQAWMLLSELPQINNNPYVFPGRECKGHLVDFKKSWATILKNAKIEDLHIHDLRRTLGSYLVQQGHSLALVGRILNHTDPRTTSIYAKFADEPIKEALEGQAKLLEGVIDVTPEA